MYYTNSIRDILFSFFSRQNQRKKNRNVDSTMTNTYMVEYDFQSGFYDSNNLKPEVGKPITYKIKNINRIAYEVIVKTRDSILSQSFVDSELIKFIETLKKDEEDANVAEELDPEISLEVNENEMLNDGAPKDGLEAIKIIQESAKLSSEIGQIKAKIKFLKEEEQKADSINPLDQKLSDKKDELTLKIKELNSIIEKNSDYENIIQDYLRENNLFYQNFSELRVTFEEILRSKHISRELATIANNPNLTYHKYKEEYSERLNKILPLLPDLIDYNNQFKYKYSEFLLNYKNLKSYLSNLNDILSPQGKYKVLIKLENIKVAAKKMDSYTKKLQIENLVQQSQRIYKLLKNEKSYEFISTPVQPMFDIVIFDVDIKHRNSNEYPITNQRKFSHKEFTRHGLRFDISAGVGGSFYSNDYSLSTEVNREEENIITRNKKDIFTPSFIGFFTASYRSATHFTFGLSAGVGISADDGSFTFDNFFIGPSMIFGRFERVFLTGGISFKNLPTLNNSYSVGDVIPNGFSIENVSNNSYRPGMFIALSYNLTKGVRENIKKYNESN